MTNSRSGLAPFQVALAHMAKLTGYPAPQALPKRTAIHDLLDELFENAGLGSGENPLGQFIKPGQTVLLKPNWVMHKNKSSHGLDCLVTNASVVSAVLDYVLKASPGKVIVGDAPVQGCDFARLMQDGGYGPLQEHYRRIGAPVEWVDFRRTTLDRSKTVWKRATDLRGMDRYTLFDLASKSLLEPISNTADRFRVTVYNPDLMRERHARGKHQYLVAREIMEADVVINLPKLKTHAKAGITAALKNVVGINGNKEFLPHHSAGGAKRGGDCYPGDSRLKLAAEYFLDAANRRSGNANAAIRQFARVSSRLARVLGEDENLEGSWYGNDTIWRTCLDLNRILLYGREDGSLEKKPQRRVLTITDAVVCGQGDGPLAPIPKALGMLTLALNSAAADYVHAHLMGFDWTTVPVVKNAFSALANFSPIDVEVLLKGRALGQPWPEWNPVPFQAPAGWRGHCERKPPQEKEVATTNL
ncbi:MAG TPA: DUF362 domain-containing protein [Verrucomicrobiae bacterium]|nr:DUF362 domain-containing protein [Verrucomicrobiae bacterium]